MYIEPCCYEKQLTELLTQIEKKSNAAHFFSNSDWDLTQLLPFFALRAPGCELTLCLVNIEQNTLDALRKLMNRMVFDHGVGETIRLVSRLTLITQGNQRAETLSHLKGFGDRVVVCEDNIGFRCLAVGNGQRHFVVQGSLNQRVLTGATQMFTLTTGAALYDSALKVLGSKSRVKVIKNWEQVYSRMSN